LASLRQREARQKLTQEICMRAFEPVIHQHLDQWYHFISHLAERVVLSLLFGLLAGQTVVRSAELNPSLAAWLSAQSTSRPGRRTLRKREP
jgi:hypothetical protein